MGPVGALMLDVQMGHNKSQLEGDRGTTTILFLGRRTRRGPAETVHRFVASRFEASRLRMSNRSGLTVT